MPTEFTDRRFGLRWLGVILVVAALLYAVNRRSEGLATGAAAPEISAQDWLNSAEPVSLAQHRRQVVVLEFWATWCPPCRASIPHLNELRRRVGNDVVIVGLTDERADDVRRFMQHTPIDYIVGAGSLSAIDYQVDGIPHAYVIDGSGKVSWSGYPDQGLDRAVDQARRTGRP